jgi:hypothetical protein
MGDNQEESFNVVDDSTDLQNESGDLSVDVRLQCRKQSVLYFKIFYNITFSFFNIVARFTAIRQPNKLNNNFFVFSNVYLTDLG